MTTVTLQNEKIKISNSFISDVYFIEQSEENGKFYITSNNGYNGFDGSGFASLEKAIKEAKLKIKNYFTDRCEESPKGFR